VYNDDLIRQLCREIVDEKDPGKANDLISLLRAVITDDQNEIRTRMAFLAKKFALVGKSNAAD